MCPFRNSTYRENEPIKTHHIHTSGTLVAYNEDALNKFYDALYKCFHENFIGTEDIKEDRRFANWRKWMEERKKLHRLLGRKYGRGPASLLMNQAEDRRKNEEIKALIEYATCLDPPDPFRGHPAFWNAPQLLPDRARCLPATVVRRPPEQEGIVPEIQHVGVPPRIQKEKNLVGENERVFHPWAKSCYLRCRAHELRPRLAYVEEFFPDTSLMVEGVGASQKRMTAAEKASREEVPALVVTDDEAVERELRREKAEMVPVVGPDAPPLAQLRVRWVDLRRDVVRTTEDADAVPVYSASGPLVWDMDFYARVGNRDSNTLRLENTGRCTLALRWIQLRGPSVHPVLDADLREARAVRPQHFFMDKRDVLCPPGQVLHFAVSFHSDEPGCFHEKWELRTEPRLAPPHRHLVVRMCGVADDSRPNAVDDYFPLEESQDGDGYGFPRLGSSVARDEELPSAEEVLRYLDRCVARTKAAEVMEELAGPCLQRAPTPPPYRSLYLEDEVFAHVNPGYHYRAEGVATLKQLFEDATGQPASEWDLSLRTLRARLLRPPRPLEVMRQQELLDTLHSASRKLQTPPAVPPGRARRGALGAAYGALCVFANDLQREAENLRELYGMRPPSPVRLETPELSSLAMQESASTLGTIPPTQRRSRVTPSDATRVRSRVRRTRQHPLAPGSALRPLSSLPSSVPRMSVSMKAPSSTVLTEQPQSPPSSTTSPSRDAVFGDRGARAEYLSALFVRVYHMLGDAVDKLVGAVDAGDLLRFDQ